MSHLTMSAVTVWQPWATLIALGLKPYEFRGWPAPVRLRGQRIAIHAGARPVRVSEVRALIMRLRGAEPWVACLRPEALDLLERVKLSPGILPLSHVLCTVELGTPVPADRILHEFGGAVANDSDRGEHFNWAWPMAKVEALEPPVPARGAQGFWPWRGA